MEIKEDNGMKSVNAVVEKLVGEGNKVNVEFAKEIPAFELFGGNSSLHHESDEIVSVSWADLKDSNVGDKWMASGNDNVEEAVIIFKDWDGVMIRFINQITNPISEYTGEKEIFVQYFHFL